MNMIYTKITLFLLAVIIIWCFDVLVYRPFTYRMNTKIYTKEKIKLMEKTSFAGAVIVATILFFVFDFPW